MKQFVRVLGVDDGYFKPKTKSKTLLVAVVYRLDGRVEGILSRKISVDGYDSTAKIIEMAAMSRFKSQIAAILLEGVNFAGFNIVDLEKLHKKTKMPIIIVFRRRPDMKKIEIALSRLPDSEKRMRLIKQAGSIHPFKNIFFQCFGIEAGKAKTLLKRTFVHSNLPEPVRLAHLIASGTTLGESTHP